MPPEEKKENPRENLQKFRKKNEIKSRLLFPLISLILKLS